MDKFKKYIETRGEEIECKICQKRLRKTNRSVGSHFGYHHKEIVEEILIPTKFTIPCLECNTLVANSNNVLSRHLAKVHNQTLFEYEIKWKYKGEVPKCKECQKDLSREKGGFRTFCSVKCSVGGKNNPMWGKKGNDSPNKGKTRTIEHREAYSRAALKRYKQDPQLRLIRQKETIERLKKGEFSRTGSFMKENPITGNEERFDSSWEFQFVEQYKDRYTDLTKDHDIQIPYISSIDGREHVYLPDFVSEDKKEIIEVKGRFLKKTADKIEAAKTWAKEHDYKFRIFTRGGYGNELYEVNSSNMLYGEINPIVYGGTKVLRWRDRNLSSRLVSEMELEEKEEVAKAVFTFYRENGFPYIQHEEETLSKEWNKLQKEDLVPKVEDDKIFLPNKKVTGNKLTQHFNSKHFFTVKCDKKNSKSMIEAFDDDEILLKVIKNRLNITYKETFNIHGAMIRQGFRSTRLAPATSTFNCSVAKYIYTQLTPQDGIVYDFSAGFGHRMLGAMASPNNLKYYACDPWTEVVAHNKQMATFINKSEQVQLWTCGSEEWKPPVELLENVDLAFSSPPYFDKEVYDSGINGQAYQDRTFDEFIEDWWKPTVQSIHSILKPETGLLAINMVEPMIDNLLEVAYDMGFEEIQRYYLYMSRSHFGKAKKLGPKVLSKFKSEPIVILRKRMPLEPL